MDHDPPDVTPELVVKLRSGDAEAGRLLDSVYRQATTRFCMGYLFSREEAEDAVQEVFFKVLAADQVPDNFRAWLFRIARNHCLNEIRKHKRRGPNQPLNTDDPVYRTQTGFLTNLVRVEQRELLVKLLASLSDEQQEALRLRYGEGLSRAEIAEILDVPEKIVKSRLFEGLKKLRDHTSILTMDR